MTYTELLDILDKSEIIDKKLVFEGKDIKLKLKGEKEKIMKIKAYGNKLRRKIPYEAKRQKKMREWCASKDKVDREKKLKDLGL